MSDLVPEEAIAVAREVAMRTQSTRASVEAAAPLIVAAYLDDLAAKADRTEKAITSFGFTDYAEGKAEGVRWAATTLRAGASVLRGEGDR